MARLRESLISGSLGIEGFVSGNVIPVEVNSSTASFDLNKGSFFTVGISSGNTYFDLNNFRPGTTANILINTVPSSTVTFSSTVKQPSGSFYTPTDDTTEDLISFACFNTSSVYLVGINDFL